MFPSGEQYEIAADGYTAVVTEVGATLRSLRYRGDDVLDGFAADALPDGGRGQVLAPWPNRLTEDRWSWDGQNLQLPVDSSDSHASASHGLVRWQDWRVETHSPDGVKFGHRLHPRPGYPFTVDLTVSYRVSSRGLAVALRARNVGEDPAPVALGAHPYLLGGSDGVDSCSLQTAGSTQLIHRFPDVTTTPVNTLPEFGVAVRLRDRRLDDTFAVHRRDDELLRIRLSADSKRVTELWTDADYLQLYTGDGLAGPRRRRGIAIEPMTAPPNALASGVGLRVLAPGQSMELRWGIARLTS